VGDGEEVGNAAIATGEGRDLAVYWRRQKGGIDLRQVGADLRFQPAFRVLGVKQTAGLIAECGEFAGVSEEFAICGFAGETGKFEAVDTQACRALGLRNVFETGDSGKFRGGFVDVHRGAMAVGEVGIEVAGVARINADGEIVLVIDVEAARLVEEAESQCGLLFAPQRDKQEEFADLQFGFACSQIGEPDEAEGEDTGRVGLRWRRGDGG